MSNSQLVKEYFIAFQTLVYGVYEKDIFSSREEKMIENFITRIESENVIVGKEWLRDYFLFQYNYYYQLSTARNITLGWIIGPKSFTRWHEKHPGWKRFIANKLLRDIKIRDDHEINKLVEFDTINALVLSADEEIQKKRFYNTTKGIAWCYQMTTLFHPKSQLCQKCNKQRACKMLAKKKYRPLFQLRLKHEQCSSQ